MKKIAGLINYEGDVVSLWSTLVPDQYILKDQWNKEMLRCDKYGVISFFQGHIQVIDSMGKSWHFPSQSREAKAKSSFLFDFLLTE
jgi:hypothetical protein